MDFNKEFDDIMGDLVDKSDSVTYVCFVMDHSTSMYSNKDQSMNNFNEMLSQLKNDSDEDMQTIVSIIEFNDTVITKVFNKPIEEVDELKTYVVGGMTALHDAISTGISTIRQMMEKDPRENKAALVIVQTDGEENASLEHKGEEGRKQIKTLIEDLESTGKWTFTFLAEGIDKEIANGLSFDTANTFCFDKTKRGYNDSLNATTGGLKNFYSMRKRGVTATKNFYGDNEENNSMRKRGVTATKNFYGDNEENN